jgi:adenine-specific DNA-methyltransferase
VTPYYDDGQVCIFNADCRDVLPALDEGTADLVLTDPPYLVDYSGRWGSDYETIANDDNDEWLLPAFQGIFRALKSSGICVSFYGWPQVDTFMTVWRQCGFRPVSHMVWVKNVWGLGYYTRGQHEPLFVLAMPETKKPDKAISDVIHFQRVSDPVHQNEKPVGALIPVIEAFCPPGGLVLDPRYIGIEVKEEHCRSAVKRLQQSVLPLEVA